MPVCRALAVHWGEGIRLVLYFHTIHDIIGGLSPQIVHRVCCGRRKWALEASWRRRCVRRVTGRDEQKGSPGCEGGASILKLHPDQMTQMTLKFQVSLWFNCCTGEGRGWESGD